METLRRALALAWLAGATLAAAADESFDVRLSPAPRDAAMRTAIAGHGSARVALRGRELAIEGTFAGFPSRATHAELRAGQAVGVRGPAIHTLAVRASADGAGTLSGVITLDDTELAALTAGHLYIQIASESAPDGNILGWLLPAAAPIVRDR